MIISGSIGITGSANLNIQMNITGSTTTVPITGSALLFKSGTTESGSLISVTGGSSTLFINIAGSQKIYVHSAGYSVYNAGVHYFYFGTTTTPTTKIFLTASGSGAYQQTFSHPRISEAGDALYLYSDITETDIPCDITYVQE